MNILYIIGNGLDIAHHMKTSYQDFFQYYLSLSTDDKDLLAMKKDIDSHRYETWADLEIGMGLYSSHCFKKDVFLKCLDDIKTHLKEYLSKESTKIPNYTVSSRSGFINPGLFLDPEPKDIYDRWIREFQPGTVIDVMTFNYTSTLEYLLGFKGSPIGLSGTTQLRSILHVHGTLDNMMVMGVNDSSQISNTSFKMDLDVKEDFVKPEYNDACMNNKNTLCEMLINGADMIVFYGTSLGESDDKWWKLIGKRMGTDKYPLLVYLPYDEKKDLSVAPNRLRRWTLEYIDEIREKFDIKIDVNVLVRRACVALNKSLFQISKAPHPSIKTK